MNEPIYKLLFDSNSTSIDACKCIYTHTCTNDHIPYKEIVKRNETLIKMESHPSNDCNLFLKRSLTHILSSYHQTLFFLLILRNEIVWANAEHSFLSCVQNAHPDWTNWPTNVKADNSHNSFHSLDAFMGEYVWFYRDQRIQMHVGVIFIFACDVKSKKKTEEEFALIYQLIGQSIFDMEHPIHRVIGHKNRKREKKNQRISSFIFISLFIWFSFLCFLYSSAVNSWIQW